MNSKNVNHSDLLKQRITDRINAQFSQAATAANLAHRRFLGQRHHSLHDMADLIQAEAARLSDMPGKPACLPVVYTYDQLTQFAEGDPVLCLGEDYAVFDSRRLPRIPNGELLLMSRITEVNGRRLDFQEGSWLVAEYDVPTDVWYIRNNSYPGIPTSIWMEIALQPCGMLLAHLGSVLVNPGQEYFFRNLDGEMKFLNRMDVRGKTITTQAVLQKTIISGTLFIHQLDFSLSCEGIPLLEGNSTFGFFPPKSLADQAGLDGGKESAPRYLFKGGLGLRGEHVHLAKSAFHQAPVGNPFLRLADGRLRLVDEIFIAPQAGKNGKGYIYASRKNDPQSWFYCNHFFQDPVMPGSLGVEAVLQGLQAYMLHQQMGRRLVTPRFDLLVNEPMVWKYRGQILPTTRDILIEAEILEYREAGDETVLIADASLWADRTRIYEIKKAAVRLVEG